MLRVCGKVTNIKNLWAAINTFKRKQNDKTESNIDAVEWVLHSVLNPQLLMDWFSFAELYFVDELLNFTELKLIIILRKIKDKAPRLNRTPYLLYTNGSSSLMSK